MKKLLLLCLLAAKSSASQRPPLSPEQIKSVAINITIYNDPVHNKEVFTEMVEKVRAFENGPFSMAALKETVDFMYEKSLKAQGIWGGAPVTYLPNAEYFDGKKNK